MVAIGRALMSNPSLLLCDELSLGLAPIMVKEIYAQLSRIAGAGMSIVIVEQDIGQALKIAARVYCLRTGHVVLSGASNSITRRDIAAAYFGD
jgi:branched-chain amino acid transport system ATP-binding protein